MVVVAVAVVVVTVSVNVVVVVPVVVDVLDVLVECTQVPHWSGQEFTTHTHTCTLSRAPPLLFNCVNTTSSLFPKWNADVYHGVWFWY